MPEVNGDYARVVVNQNLTGWPDQRTIWGVRVIDPESPLSAADAGAIAARFATFYTAIADQLSTAWAIESFSITDYNTPTAPSHTIDSVVVGTAVGDLLPPDTAAVLSLRTANRGRSYRGRVYIGGLTEAACTAGGEVAAATRTDVEAAAATLINNLQADGFPLSVVSTISNNAPRATAEVTAITGATMNTVFDRQKRRARR